MRVARAAVCLLAVLVCAWFILGARQAHDLSAATTLVTGGQLSAAQAAEASSLLNGASTLNPDSEVTLVRAQLASVQGEHGRALALALRVTRDEPRNVVAWDELARVSDNGPYLGLALHEIRRLAPPVRSPR
jgi:hypothetical protein